MELQAKFEEFKKRGVQLLSKTIEAPESNKRMREKTGSQFEILSDEAGKLIDHFGMRHVKGKRGQSDLAQSASFLLDQNGKVLWQRIAENYRVRPKPEEILQALDKINTNAAKPGRFDLSLPRSTNIFFDLSAVILEQESEGVPEPRLNKPRHYLMIYPSKVYSASYSPTIIPYSIRIALGTSCAKRRAFRHPNWNNSNASARRLERTENKP